jgi:hypothetical protein
VRERGAPLRNIHSSTRATRVVTRDIMRCLTSWGAGTSSKVGIMVGTIKDGKGHASVILVFQIAWPHVQQARWLSLRTATTALSLGKRATHSHTHTLARRRVKTLSDDRHKRAVSHSNSRVNRLLARSAISAPSLSVRNFLLTEASVSGASSAARLALPAACVGGAAVGMVACVFVGRLNAPNGAKRGLRELSLPS